MNGARWTWHEVVIPRLPIRGDFDMSGLTSGNRRSRSRTSADSSCGRSVVGRHLLVRGGLVNPRPLLEFLARDGSRTPPTLEVASDNPSPQLVHGGGDIAELDWRSDRPGRVPQGVSLFARPHTPFDDDVASGPKEVEGKAELELLDAAPYGLGPEVDASCRHPIVWTESDRWQ
jgi:hypothetical protein